MTARTMQAHPAGEEHVRAQLAHGQSGMPTALLGMLLFIASEVMFFGGLFATYFNARASAVGEWGPPPPAPELEMLPIALPLTIILVSSSFTMQFGVWAIRRGDQRQLRMWVALTLLLGVSFLVGQLYDYTTLGFTISDGVFGTTFYTLTGFHGAHVFGCDDQLANPVLGIAGLLVLVAGIIAWVRAASGEWIETEHRPHDDAGQ